MLLRREKGAGPRGKEAPFALAEGSNVRISQLDSTVQVTHLSLILTMH